MRIAVTVCGHISKTSIDKRYYTVKHQVLYGATVQIRFFYFQGRL